MAEDTLTPEEIARLRRAVGVSPKAKPIERATEEVGEEGRTELFVKVDAQKAIAHDIVVCKEQLKNLVDTVKTLSKVEADRQNWMNSLESAIEALESKLSSVESRLPGLPAILRQGSVYVEQEEVADDPPYQEGSVLAASLDEDLSSLREEIADMKAELEKLK